MPTTDGRDLPADLSWRRDDGPGIRRRGGTSGWSYRHDDGGDVTDAATLARIGDLAIPPAWTDVWIAPGACCHIQATGRDARGRKQYRYHARWMTAQAEGKFDRMVAFASALPRLRKRVDRDLRRRVLPREKVLGAVVAMLELTVIRVGNDECAQQRELRSPPCESGTLPLWGPGRCSASAAIAGRTTAPASTTGDWRESSASAPS